MNDERMTLAEFLLARIDEDEESARAAADQVRRFASLLVEDENPDDPTDFAEAYARGWASLSYSAASGHIPAIRAHLLAQDPARVLAECEARRQIIVRLAGVLASDDYYAPAEMAQQMLETLALPYADHLDYRDEWRAET